MKKLSLYTLTAASLLMAAKAQSLYYVGDEAQESIPLKWVVGVNAVWDDNVSPIAGAGESATSINPYIGVSTTKVSPQTVIDLYARVGITTYLDSPDVAGLSDTNGNGRLGLDLSHQFSERLRFSSRNFIAYEMEPEYAYGVATDHYGDPYTYWSTDNAVGYRWTERLATYTGFTYTGYQTDNDYGDRDSFGFYHSFRYQLSQRSVGTLEYRYNQWSGGSAQDSTSHFYTVGLEHRFSPTAIATFKVGAQTRDSDNGNNSTDPFFEAAVSSQLNSRMTAKAFARYSMEDYDIVRNVGLNTFEYSNNVLRIGLTGDYALTPKTSIFGGLDYINTDYVDGQEVGGPATDDGGSESLINAYLGVRVKLTEALSAEASVNYTDSTSDFDSNREYDRTRFSVGASYTF